MRNKKILISGLAGLLILGIGLGLHLTFRAQRTAEVPQIKEEPALKAPIALPKEIPLDEVKIEAPLKPEPAKIAQPAIEEKKEPEYLEHLKEAGIEVEEYKNLPTLGKVISEHKKELGYPKVETNFPEELPKDYIPGELLVKRIIWLEGNAYKLEYDRLTVTPGQELQAISELKREANVVTAKPNFSIKVESGPTISIPVEPVRAQVVAQTNYDPDFSQQWGLTKIKAPDAWDIEKGKDTLKIAVIDSGADLNHPDLINNLDLPSSYDFVNDDAEPQDDAADGHGTHVAGIIGARGFNGIGVHGLMNTAKLVILKALDATGSQTDMAVLVDAITEALDIGSDTPLNPDDDVRIINMSWGTPTDLRAADDDLKDVLDAAFASDVLLVAAAGNQGQLLYPAKYSEVLAVGGTDENDSRWQQAGYESAYGPEVDVSAPAKNIYSTKLDDIYGNLSGTSMACGFVSGLAGLLLSKDATLSKERLIQIIKEKIDQVTPEPNKPIGGRINALLALQELIPPPPPGNQPPVADIKAEPTQGNPQLTVHFDGSGSTDADGQIVEYKWEYGDNTAAVIGGEDKKTVEHTYNTVGIYTAGLTVKDDDGATGSASIVITVGQVGGGPGMAWLKGRVISGVLSGKGLADYDIEASDVADTDNPPLKFRGKTDKDGYFQIQVRVAANGSKFRIKIIPPECPWGKIVGGDGTFCKSGGGDGINPQGDNLKYKPRTVETERAILADEIYTTKDIALDIDAGAYPLVAKGKVTFGTDDCFEDEDACKEDDDDEPIETVAAALNANNKATIKGKVTEDCSSRGIVGCNPDIGVKDVLIVATPTEFQASAAQAASAQSVKTYSTKTVEDGTYTLSVDIPQGEKLAFIVKATGQEKITKELSEGDTETVDFKITKEKGDPKKIKGKPAQGIHIFVFKVLYKGVDTLPKPGEYGRYMYGNQSIPSFVNCSPGPNATTDAQGQFVSTSDPIIPLPDALGGGVKGAWCGRSSKEEKDATQEAAYLLENPYYLVVAVKWLSYGMEGGWSVPGIAGSEGQLNGAYWYDSKSIPLSDEEKGKVHTANLKLKKKKLGNGGPNIGNDIITVP